MEPVCAPPSHIPRVRETEGGLLGCLSSQSSAAATAAGWQMWPGPTVLCLGSVVTGQQDRARGCSQGGLGVKGSRGQQGMAHRVVDSGIGTLALKNPQRKGGVMEL